MPEYLTPGVYVEEIETGPKPIEGVSTTTTAILGKCDRGPMSPTLVTSFIEYVRLYGDHSEAGEGNQLPYAVQGFFANGGKRCYVTRIAGNGSKSANLEIEKMTIQAFSNGIWGNSIAIELCEEPREGSQSQEELFKLTVYYFPEEHKKEIAKKIAEAKAGKSDLSPLEKTFNEEKAKVETARKALDDEKNKKPQDKSKIEGKEGDYKKAQASFQQAEAAYNNAKSGESSETSSRAYKNVFKSVEEFDNLSLKPNSKNFFENRINEVSNFIKVDCPEGARLDSKSIENIHWLKNGQNVSGKIDLEDYKGLSEDEPKKRTGLAGLNDIPEISLICSPDESSVDGLTGALVDFCEDSQRCFAILQADNKYSVQNQRPKRPSQYAAHYYPWISVMNPVVKRPKNVAPCGHVAGVYARTDITKGVHKAPANETLRDCYGLSFPVNHAEQEILNPRGVNCIRAFEGQGIKIWGARTTSSDASWKYVNVRRLFIFLKSSIERGTQWVVFEPNDHRLWDRIRQSVSNFLLTQWRNGALMGRKEEEAFFVKCDETTMTQDDIDNGRLIILIGVAPVKPAEFVVFRIAQFQSGS